MTNQEAFTSMVLHLRKQQARSQADGSTQCLYRNHAGLKCAVGCLIPDDVYSPGMEKTSAIDLPAKSLAVRDLLAGVDLSMLQEMQSCHDVISVEYWECEFKRVAHNYGLEIPA